MAKPQIVPQFGRASVGAAAEHALKCGRSRSTRFVVALITDGMRAYAR